MNVFRHKLIQKRLVFFTINIYKVNLIINKKNINNIICVKYKSK